MLIFEKIQFKNIQFNYNHVNDGDKVLLEFKNKNRIKNEENIDLIIIDLNMTIMNGDEATK